MVTIEMGNKKRKFKSIKEAAEAAGINYISFYMRLRAGMSPVKAIKMPVREYNKRKENV